MGTKESVQEMTETQLLDLPQDGFQLADHVHDTRIHRAGTLQQGEQ